MFKNLLKNAATSITRRMLAAGQIIGHMLFNRPSKYKLKFCLVLSLNLIAVGTAFAQLPVSTSRPRIFLNATIKADMMAKKNAADPNWAELLADANKYLPKQVIPWNEETASASEYYGTGDIFYSYCGSSWEEAAITLGMAHQLTKTNNAGANATAYSNKLMLLADCITKAYADYPPNENYQPNIFQFNSSYATRHVGKTIAIIYDWCYDELSPARKAALLHVMKDWFTFMSSTPYRLNQLQDDPTGNYFIGHLICAGYMGYAIGSDDPMSQKMIDFARNRLTGAPGTLNPDKQASAEMSNAYFTQSVKGGLVSAASKSYLGPSTVLGAPQRDGIPVQGWSYGRETSNFLLDYLAAMKSATGENMINTDPDLKLYFSKTAEALVHAYTPNGFMYDNSNDNGSFLGCVTAYALPLRLAALLEGTTAGSNIEYFRNNLLKAPNLLSGNPGYASSAWEKLLYEKTRVATPFTYKPYYPAPTTNVYNAIPVNTGLNKYYLRNNWTAASTWAVVELHSAVYDQHNHNNAGHFKIVRGDSHDGDDQLLVASNEVPKGGGNGIDGATNYSYGSSFSNTLFFDDYNDYDTPYPDYVATVGGQTSGGFDEPTHQEQNDKFSYFRSDLTSAYYVGYTDPDTTQRTLRYYYRSFLYLRSADVFVVYDKLQAKNSSNAKGQYKKHIRWHFLNQPVISGNNITETMDNSKLFIHTVLPAAVNVTKVDENNNPDNTFGSDVGYIFNTNTWRAEVSVPNNPLKQDVVTVMQPGAKTATEMVTTAIATSQNNMEGSLITVNGNTEVVLFNNSIAKYPVPVSVATYAYTGPAAGTHTLCGLAPDQKYTLAYNGATVTVTKSAAGTVTASPSGVLSFTLQAPATSTDLVNLVPGSGTLSPVFNKDVLTYTVSVENTISSITFTPTASNVAAVIKVKGAIVVSGSATSLALVVGANTIPITVTAGGVTKTYTVTVNRALSNIATLSAMSLSTGKLTEVTGPASHNYVASVGNTISSITLKAVSADAGAVIKVNGIITPSGVPSAPIALALGDNIINVLVTAADGLATRTYRVTITRAPSNIATLSGLSLSTGKLTEVAGPASHNYVASVGTTISSVTLKAVSADAGAVIKVNGIITPSGVSSAPIALVPGDNIINVLVTAADGLATRTYRVTVTRAAPSNIATLSGLSLSTGKLNEVTGPASHNYVAAVGNTISSVTLKAVSTNAGAVIKVKGIITPSGVASAPIALVPGDNVFDVLVTAEDGVATRIYRVTVARAAPPTLATVNNNNKITVLQKTDGFADVLPEELTVRQGLSPNGDGINDNFVIEGINAYPDNKVSIINRNGGVVYEAKGYDNYGKVFDGHAAGGALLQAGTYFYSIEYKAGDTVKRKSGYLVIKY